MKKILFTLLATAFLLGLSYDSKASHLAGGEIWYEYAGDAQHPYRYDIYLIIYRDISGVAMCPGYCPAPICITSGCYPNQDLSAPLLPFTIRPGSDTVAGSWPGSIKTPELTDCVNTTSPDLVFTEAYRFYTQVDLPGPCSDYVFSYSANARNPSDNLTTTGNHYLEAKLNNTIGTKKYNTSPKFLNPAAKAFCAYTPFVWSQAAVEPDGDSIYYDFGTPFSGGCRNKTPIGFRAGYSVSDPMSTVNGINFDHRRGTLRFIASQPEVVVINITIKEFRYDSTYSRWLEVGSSVRDLQVPVVASSDCRSAAQNGPQFSDGIYGKDTLTTDSLRGYGIAKISNDSTYNASTGKWEVYVPIIDYTCFSSAVTVNFDDGVYCETISPDGTDFRLIGPDSVMRPIVGVTDNCRPDLVTKKIDLQLHKPLDVNGDYFLIIKNGNDKNTLTNKCGFPLEDGFVIMLRVDDCPILDYQLLNVSVEDDRNIRIDWEADPTTFSEDLFNNWQILRSTNGQFYKLDTNFTNVYARTFLDTTVGYEWVDANSFQYAIQMVQNFSHKSPTNIGRSILLKNLGENGEASDLEWSAYDTWDDTTYIAASYQVEMQSYDTTGGITQPWEIVAGPTAGMFNWTFNWSDVGETEKDRNGIYGFRVKATEPQDPNNPFVSESNWIYVRFVPEPDPKPENPVTGIIPNVFTPNGDMQNELFLLPFNTYSNITLSVYNRWGKLVYEDVNAPREDYIEGGKGWDGTDMNSGTKLADGTYFYVISFNDEPTGESTQIKGHVNIFGLGTK